MTFYDCNEDTVQYTKYEKWVGVCEQQKVTFE